MMKKTLFMLIFFISILASLCAVDNKYDELITRPFTLQAGVKEVIDAYVNRIPSQTSELFSVGMPFDIENTMAHYKKNRDTVLDSTHIFGIGNGLLIAEWGFIANCPFAIKIDASPLKHSQNGYSLDYSLAFACTVNYKIADKLYHIDAYVLYDTVNDRILLVDSSNGIGDHVKDNVPISGSNNGVDIKKLISSGTNSFIGSANGNVYFGFTEETTNKIKNSPDEVPEGKYSATVTLTLTADV